MTKIKCRESGFVATAGLPLSDASGIIPAMELDQIINAAGGIGPLAALAGVQYATVSVSWRRTGKVPVERAWVIHEALGIPLHELRPDVWRPVNNEEPAHNSSEIAD